MGIIRKKVRFPLFLVLVGLLISVGLDACQSEPTQQSSQEYLLQLLAFL
jgi:hypothetical protein